MYKKFEEDFVRQCLAGNAFLDEIDDYVDRWHENSEGISLRKFLGMSEEEYNLWVVDDSVLPFIVAARMKKTSVQDELAGLESMPIAARSPRPDLALKVMAYLKKKGITD